MSPEPRSWARSSVWEPVFSEPLWTVTRARLSMGVRREVVLRRRAPVERLVCSAASWDISWVTNTCFNAATEQKKKEKSDRFTEYSWIAFHVHQSIGSVPLTCFQCFVCPRGEHAKRGSSAILGHWIRKFWVHKAFFFLLLLLLSLHSLKRITAR